MVKISHMAPLVKQLVQSALILQPSGRAIGQLESNSVPLYPVREEKKCVDVATCDSSTLAPDCTDWTSGDQGRAMCAASCAGSTSILTCTLDVVNGSVSLTGSLPNCSAALCVVDGIPNGMSHDCDGITFLESCHGNRSKVTCPSTSHLPPCLVDPVAFSSATLHTSNIGETIVDNNVNNATHVDLHKLQH